MAEKDKNALRDGWISLEGGMDSGKPAMAVGDNQSSFMVNTTVRGGFPKHRPPFKKIAKISDPARFQHAFFFDGSGYPMIVFAIAGRFYRVDMVNFAVEEFTPNRADNVVTVQPFTVPAIGATVSVNIANTEGISSTYPTITINGVTWTLDSIVDDASISVVNLTEVPTTVIPIGTAVQFTLIDQNNPSARIGWSVEAENYWIYQDGKTIPLIFNGATAVRSNQGLKQVPVGTVMEYGMGRLTVALPDRQTYRIGDLAFGSSGTVANGYRDAVLYFTENDYLNGGGDLTSRLFGTPANSGPIRAMRYIAQPDTQLGQGPLMIFCSNVIFSVNAPFDRTQWASTTNPIQTVAAINDGAMGQDSTIILNSDIYYRSDVGDRTLIQARRDSQSPGNVSISAEMDRVQSKDDKWLLEFGSTVYFDNRKLQTASPVITEYGVYHRCLTSLDFDITSSIRGKQPPVWEGIWTGLRFLKVLTGTVNNVLRCFVVALNPANEIELWELMTDGEEDDYISGTQPIQWAIEGKSLNFNSIFDVKRLKGGMLNVQNVNGDVNVTLLYREDGQPCWRSWYSFEVCGKMEECDFTACSIPKDFKPQSRPKVHIPPPPEVDDIANGKITCVGQEFQPRIEITGTCELRGFRMDVYPEQETVTFENAQT